MHLLETSSIDIITFETQSHLIFFDKYEPIHKKCMGNYLMTQGGLYIPMLHLEVLFVTLFSKQAP